MADITLSPIPYNGGSIDASYINHTIEWIDKTNDKFVYCFRQTNPDYWFLGLVQINNLATSTPTANYIKQRAFIGRISYPKIHRISDTRFALSFYTTTNTAGVKIYDISTDDFVEVSSGTFTDVKNSLSIRDDMVVWPISNNNFLLVYFDTSNRVKINNITFTDGSPFSTSASFFSTGFSVSTADRNKFLQDRDGNLYLASFDNYYIELILKASSGTYNFSTIFSGDITASLFLPVSTNKLILFSYNTANVWYEYQSGTTWNAISESWSPSNITLPNVNYFIWDYNTIVSINTGGTNTNFVPCSYEENSGKLVVSPRFIVDRNLLFTESSSTTYYHKSRNEGDYFVKYGTNSFMTIRKWNSTSPGLWRINVVSIVDNV